MDYGSSNSALNADGSDDSVRSDSPAEQSQDRSVHPVQDWLKNHVYSKVESRLLAWIDADRFLPIQLDITNLCNLRCTHCYHPHHRNEGALSLEDLKNILSQYDALIRKLRFRPKLILCGGEPLLSPFIRPILEYARALDSGYEILILTNGTLIPGFELEQFRQFKKVTFQVSLDGPDSESHDRVRGKGSFEKAKAGAAKLVTEGFEVQLLATLSKNSAPLIQRFFETAKLWGAAHMGFTRLIQQGHADALVKSGQDRPLSAHELKAAYCEMLHASAESSIMTYTNSPLMRLLHPSLGRSGRFWEGIIVDYCGNLLASSRSRLVLGSLKSEKLEKLFLQHPLLKSLRKGEISGCSDCRFLRRCGGDRNAAFAHSGNFLGRDPGCWTLSETQKKNTLTSKRYFPLYLQGGKI